MLNRLPIQMKFTFYGDYIDYIYSTYVVKSNNGNFYQKSNITNITNYYLQ